MHASLNKIPYSSFIYNFKNVCWNYNDSDLHEFQYVEGKTVEGKNH